MNLKRILSLGISFIIYLLLQTLILKGFVIADMAFCFIYVSFILLLPFELATIVVLLLSFLMGISVDIFYDTLGIHTAASVLIGYLRSKLLPIIKPFGREYNKDFSPTIASMGLAWFVSCSAILILIHHLMLFFIEAANIGLFLQTSSSALASSIFTFIMILLFQYLFYGRKKEKY